jgi:antitoxin ParD1/3/4
MHEVQLTPRLAEFVEAQVASGLYADASEVIRAGLRRLMEQEDAALGRLRAALIEGEESGPGEPFDVEAFLKERRPAS